MRSSGGAALGRLGGSVTAPTFAHGATNGIAGLPMFSSGIGAWFIFQREAEVLSQLERPLIVRFVAAH